MAGSKIMGKTELLHVQLIPKVKKALKKDAKERGKGMSNIVADMLYEYYFGHPFNEPEP